MTTFNQKTAIVTGAAGFIGVHLSQRLLKDGFNVIAVDNLSTGSENNKKFLEKLGSNLKFIKADVSEPWTWVNQVGTDWLKNLDVVYHFASPASPVNYQK